MAKKKYNSRRNKSVVLPSIKSLIVPLAVLLCLWVANSLHGCNSPEDDVTSTGHYGNLTHVVTNPSLPSQQKSYTGMDLSFNSKLHVPNWVSWELTAEETNGTVTRGNKFYNDPDIDGCPETWDYSYSGYDRGHMAPAGDMKWSKQAMDDTFYLSNICPQDTKLNTGTWRTLEEKCRSWAKSDGKIYIVCGPIVEPGARDEYIGDTRVWVPKRFFKVVISPYANPARGIGFIMPNSKVEGGMQACAVSIDEVEELTGNDFFSTLPDDIENRLESQCNFNEWALAGK